MVRTARRRLRGVPTAARDEEDVALSAFKSFCLRVQSGRIAVSSDEVNLWPILVTITMNKAVDSIRYENRQKRRSTSHHEEPIADWSDVSGIEPTPDMIATAADSLECMLVRLDQTGDTDLREIAVASIEGSSSAEIAVLLRCTQRTVQRKLKTIEKLWKTNGPV